MRRQQDSLRRFCPATGTPKPYPRHAEQWRLSHGQTAWLFNPWSDGPQRRDARDVGRDLFGYLIVPEGEPVMADTAERDVPTKSQAPAGKAVGGDPRGLTASKWLAYGKCTW